MSLRRVHLATACLLLIFILAHIANHLGALGGVANHLAVMDILRLAYRNIVVETILLAAFAFQVVIGLRLLLRAKSNVSGLVGWAQLLSGGYLAFFVTVHVGAVLSGRMILGLDTNFWFAVAGYSAGILKLWFTPYYFLSVLALFVHLGCAAYWLTGARKPVSQYWFMALAIAGAVISTLISTALMGGFEDFEVPARYLEPYSAFL
ncbi:MAG: hypothetical protein WBO55_03720 [Rhizobiaceae bacterium]